MDIQRDNKSENNKETKLILKDVIFLGNGTELQTSGSLK